MAISFVAAGAQAAHTGQGAAGTVQTITAPAPAGIQQNDFLLAIQASRAFGAVEPTYTFDSGLWTEIGHNRVSNIQLRVYRSVVPASPPPDYDVTVSDATGGFTSQIIAYRGVDLTSPVDVLTLEGSTNVQDFEPGVLGINAHTTTQDNSRTVSIVASMDDNEIAILTPNGFTGRIGGGAYSLSAPSMAVAAADKVQASAGRVTFLVWRQIINFPDYWAGVHVSLREAPGGNTFQEPTDLGLTVVGSATDVYNPSAQFGKIIDLQRRRVVTVVG